MSEQSPRSGAFLLSLLASVSIASIAGLGVGCSSKPAAREDDQSDGVSTQKNDAGKSEDADAATPDPVGSNVAFQFLPPQAYSGYDGVHEFKVPVAVYGAPTAKLTASDPAAVSIVPTKLSDPTGDDGVWFMITVKKAGEFTLTAESDGKTAEGKLSVATYTPESFVKGSQRYTTGNGTDPPCTQCHAGGKAIDHSPAKIASVTDKQVISVIRTGVLVAGNPILTTPHRWQVTDEQASGLVTYLRALPPRNFEEAKPE